MMHGAYNVKLFRFITTVRTPYWDCRSTGTQWAIKVSRLGANKMDKFVHYFKICLQHQCVKDFISDVWHYSTVGARPQAGKAGKA